MNPEPRHDGPRPPAALLDEVERDCAALARTRRRRLAGFIVVSLGILGFWVLHTRVDHGAQIGGSGFAGPGVGQPLHGILMALLIGGGFLLCGLAFGLRLPTGRRLRLVPLGAVVGTLGVLFTLSAAFGSSHLDPFGAACLGSGGWMAAGVLAAAMLFGRSVLRRHAPSAALYGVGAGMLALVPLSSACHVATLGHLMVWHGLVPVFTGFVAWGISRVWDQS